jgi:hypothetical protein
MGLTASIDDQVLARMVTTIDDNTNGFRLDIIPIALSGDAGSQSLLQATLALSSYHLGREEDALSHKVRALKSLSESFQHSNASRLSQFAACMMLCVYSVSQVRDTLQTEADIMQGIRRIRYDVASPFARCEIDQCHNDQSRTINATPQLLLIMVQLPRNLQHL